MTANEWLKVMKQAQDFPNGMEKLIVKYGEMLIAEHESKVKKLTIPYVINRRELLVAYDNFRLMTSKKFSCSEEAIDDFLATNSL